MFNAFRSKLASWIAPADQSNHFASTPPPIATPQAGNPSTERKPDTGAKDVVPPTLSSESTEKDERFSEESYEFYRGIAASGKEGAGVLPFILLDAKTLPRSGLHYLKSVLSRALEDSFSFCEWYQQPGCCKKMPCHDTSYARHALEKGVPRLRLQKSHDFDLRDPMYLTTDVMRRVILVRDPLYQLTSWFALTELNRYSTTLTDVGIGMKKIWLSHEPEVVARAFEVVDAIYEPPDQDYFDEWFAKRAGYVHAFLDKWLAPAEASRQGVFHEVVPYEGVERYARKLLTEICPALTEEARTKVERYLGTGNWGFNKRTDPYSVHSARISQFMKDKSDAFAAHAEVLRPILSRTIELKE